MKAVVFLIAVAVIASAVGLGVNASRMSSASNAALVDVRENDMVVSAAIRQAEWRLKSAAAAEERLRAELASFKEEGLSRRSADPAKANPAGTAAAAGVQKATLSKQEIKEALGLLEYMARERLNFLRAYGPFFAQLGMTSAQVEQFVAIGLERFEQIMDVNLQFKNDHNNPLAEALRQQALAKEEAGHRALLGEAGYQRLLEYDRTISARDKVAVIGADAVLAGVPYTVAQLEAMIPIIANNGRGYSKRGALVNWEIVSPQLRTLMSEAQWKVYETRASERMNNTFEAAIQKAAEADRAENIAQSANATSR